MIKLNYWENLFLDFLDFTEFSLRKDKKGYWVEDRQGANYGDIESDRFSSATAIFDRMSHYIDDYIFRSLEENYGKDCPYWTSTEWIAHRNDEEIKKLDCDWDIDCLDMIDNHSTEINLDNCYRYINDDDAQYAAILNKFMSINENAGWDSSIDYLKQISINDTVDEQLKTLISIYNKAYYVVKDNDVDGGLCFKIRDFAMQEIINILESLVKTEGV